MIKSDQINELAAALCKAQGSMEAAKKDASNPFFKSKYADLTSVWEAIRRPLSDNGLSVSQVMHANDRDDLLETILLHSSGQWLSSTMIVRTKDDTPQALGSGVTYARRYALAAIVGVTQDDDDGQAAQKKTFKQTIEKVWPIADERAEPPQNSMALTPYHEWGPEGAPDLNKTGVEYKQAEARSQKMNTLSEAQIERLWKMSLALKWAKEDTLTSIKQQFKKSKPEELTREEYTLFTSKLQVEIDKLKYGK